VRNGDFAVPGGADPVLAAHGLVIENDPSEGAYPSGISAIARAALALDALGAGSTGTSTGADASGAYALRDVVVGTLEPIAPLALTRPISFGSALGVLSSASTPHRQLVVVTEDSDVSRPDAELARLARGWSGGIAVVVTSSQARAFADAGFELFEARGTADGRPTAYLCENFVCQLPVTTAGELAGLLA
jgi:uncharacterized protein YyaL (SSP411 family)